MESPSTANNYVSKFFRAAESEDKAIVNSNKLRGVLPKWGEDFGGKLRPVQPRPPEQSFLKQNLQRLAQIQKHFQQGKNRSFQRNYRSLEKYHEPKINKENQSKLNLKEEHQTNITLVQLEQKYTLLQQKYLVLMQDASAKAKEYERNKIHLAHLKTKHFNDQAVLEKLRLGVLVKTSHDIGQIQIEGLESRQSKQFQSHQHSRVNQQFPWSHYNTNESWLKSPKIERKSIVKSEQKERRRHDDDVEGSFNANHVPPSRRVSDKDINRAKSQCNIKLSRLEFNKGKKEQLKSSVNLNLQSRMKESGLLKKSGLKEVRKSVANAYAKYRFQPTVRMS